MGDTEGVYRRLITTKNNSKDIKRRAFCGAGFYKRREKKLQREEKEEEKRERN